MSNLIVSFSGSDISDIGALHLTSTTVLACWLKDGESSVVLAYGDVTAEFPAGTPVGVGNPSMAMDTLDSAITGSFYDGENDQTEITLSVAATDPAFIYVATEFTTGDNLDLNTYTDLTSANVLEVATLSNGSCTGELTVSVAANGVTIDTLNLLEGATADANCSFTDLRVHGYAFTDSDLPFHPSTAVNVNFPDQRPDFQNARIVVSADWNENCSAWTGLDFWFTGIAINYGTVPGTSNFYDDAVNGGTVEYADFRDRSVCNGTVTMGASFFDWAHASEYATLPSNTVFEDASYFAASVSTGFSYRSYGVVSLPSPDEVKKDTSYGMPSNLKTGTLEASPAATLPDPSEVKAGVVYGVEGDLKTGTMKTGQGIGGSGILGMP